MSNGQNVFEGAQFSKPIQSGAVTGIYSPNLAQGNAFELTALGSVIFGPLFIQDCPGQGSAQFTFKVIQGGAGSNAITFGSSWQVPAGLTFSANPGSYDIINGLLDSSGRMTVIAVSKSPLG